jgi:serine/threonine-protein kinase
MAPEQLGGERGDARADLFALGVIAYELLTGEHLFQSRKFSQLIEERLKWAMPSRNDIPAELDREFYALLEVCLRDSAEQRDVDLEQISGWAASINWSSLCPGDERQLTSGDSSATPNSGATQLN